MPSTSRCAYKDCLNTPSKCAEHSFHRFPKDKAGQVEWINRAGVPKLLGLTPQQLVNKRICSAHFQENDFINFNRTSGKRKLKGNAVPLLSTLKSDLVCKTLTSQSQDKDPGEGTNGSCAQPPDPPLPPPLKEESSVSFSMKEASGISVSAKEASSVSLSAKEASNISFSAKEASSASLSAPNNVTWVRKPQLTFREQKLTRRITKLTMQLKTARQSIRRLNRKLEKIPSIPKIMEGAAAYMDKDSLLLFSMQFDHMKHLAWSDDEKQFALDLFHKSPKAYKFLRDEKKFTLPCLTLIRQWINELKS